MLVQGYVCTKMQDNMPRRMEGRGTGQSWLSVDPVARFLQSNTTSITALLAAGCLNLNRLGPATGAHTYSGAALVLSGLSPSCHQPFDGPDTSAVQEPRLFPLLTAWCISRGGTRLPARGVPEAEAGHDGHRGRRFRTTETLPPRPPPPKPVAQPPAAA